MRDESHDGLEPTLQRCSHSRARFDPQAPRSLDEVLQSSARWACIATIEPVTQVLNPVDGPLELGKAAQPAQPLQRQGQVELPVAVALEPAAPQQAEGVLLRLAQGSYALTQHDAKCFDYTV